MEEVILLNRKQIALECSSETNDLVEATRLLAELSQPIEHHVVELVYDCHLVLLPNLDTA